MENDPRELIAFVHIPKTAGITVNLVLRNSFGALHCDVQSLTSFTTKVTANDFKWLRITRRSLRSIAGHHLTVYGDLQTLFPGDDDELQLAAEIGWNERLIGSKLAESAGSPLLQHAVTEGTRVNGLDPNSPPPEAIISRMISEVPA